MTIDGIPLHPLIVHAVVVLIPLAALGTLAVAARPAWRRIYGIPVLALAAAGLVAVQVARISGEDLVHMVAHGSSALDAHMMRADTVLPAAIVYVLLLAAAVLLGIREDRAAERGSGGNPLVRTRVVPILAVLAAVAGLVVTFFVVWTGHAGATATWSM